MRIRRGDVIEVAGRPVAVTGCSWWATQENGAGRWLAPGATVSGVDDNGATVFARLTYDGWTDTWEVAA